MFLHFVSPLLRFYLYYLHLYYYAQHVGTQSFYRSIFHPSLHILSFSTYLLISADPSALGLFGLAIITLVASSQKLELTSSVSLVIPWAIFLGATAQLMASIHDFKHNNTFGATAFGAMETHKVLFTIFVLIDFLFLGLTLSSFGIATHATHMMAAYAELGIAIVSFYGCGASVLNAHFGKVFLPVGKPFGIFK